MRAWRVFPAALAVLAGFMSAACEAALPPQPEGEQQVAWGESVYDWHCARCHADDRSAVALTAEVLTPTHANALDLFEFTRQAMPLDAPGSLPDEDYWAAVAFLLDREGILGLPSGEVLDEENAESVEIGTETQLDIVPGGTLDQPGGTDGD